MEKYDLKFQKAYLLRRTGGIACQQGRIKAGLSQLETAREIYGEIEEAVLGLKLTCEIIVEYSSR